VYFLLIRQISTAITTYYQPLGSMSSGDASQFSSLLSAADAACASTMLQQPASVGRCCWVGHGCTKVKKMANEDYALMPCTLEGCENVVHHACWQQFLLSVLKRPMDVTEVR